MDIQMLTPIVVLTMAEAMTRATAQGKTFRIATGSHPTEGKWIKWKVGEGMWSAPYFAAEDY